MILTLLLGVVSTGYCARFSGDWVEFNYPDGWFVVDGGFNISVYRKEAETGDKFAPSFEIISIPGSAKISGLSEAKGLFDAEFGSRGYQIAEERDGTLSGMPAKIFLAESSDGFERIYQVYVAPDGIVVSAHLYANDNLYDEVFEQTKIIFDTLKLK